MVGTLINAALIIIGSLLGLIFKKFIKEEKVEALIKSVGLAVLVIAIIGIVANSISYDGKIRSSYEIEVLIIIVLGALIGEIIRLDDRINNMGSKLEKKLGLGNFSTGFVSASIIYLAGAMAVFGPINEVLNGDATILITKSILDMIVSIVLASTLGIGVLFSFIPVLVYQGFFALFGFLIEGFITDDIIAILSVVGYAIILTIGLNQMKIANIKTANLIPAVFLVFLYGLIQLFL